MKRWAIGRPSLTNVVVTVVLVTIFSTGSAVAALTVRSIDIVDGEVKTVDLANGAVTNAKIAGNAVTGSKVDESTLAIVPNANMLDGKDSTAFARGPGRVVTSSTGYSWGDSVYVFVYGASLDVGFNMAVRCSNDQIYFTNYTSSAMDIWYRHNGSGPVYRNLTANGTAGDTYSSVESDGPHMVTVHFAVPGTSKQGVVDFSVWEVPPPGADGYGNCYEYVQATLNF